jgi:GntR family transcriptional repressor for pyruvate dehydrogenase complex
MSSRPLFKNIGRNIKAYEEITNQVRKKIFSGTLKLGQRLPTEREMAKQFGLSRVVVREAIRTLELSGFVTVKKGARGGIFVAQDYERPIEEMIANLMNSGEVSLKDLFEVRAIIESYAAARAAEVGTEEEFDKLSNLIEEACQESTKGTNIRSYNIRFHRLILGMTHNLVLSMVGETVLSMLSEQIKDLFSPEISLEVLEKHKIILKAIIQRDADVVARLVAEDIKALGVLFDKIS